MLRSNFIKHTSRQSNASLSISKNCRRTFKKYSALICWANRKVVNFSWLCISNNC